jgi:hypothetical protein
MDAQVFHVGDRVRLTRRIAVLPEGTRGTVEKVFEGAELYDVCFDEPFCPQIVLGSELERLEREIEMGQT